MHPLSKDIYLNEAVRFRERCLIFHLTFLKDKESEFGRPRCVLSKNTMVSTLARENRVMVRRRLRIETLTIVADS